jgi:hypothetical protein
MKTFIPIEDDDIARVVSTPVHATFIVNIDYTKEQGVHTGVIGMGVFTPEAVAQAVMLFLNRTLFADPYKEKLILDARHIELFVHAMTIYPTHFQKGPTV